MNNITTKLGYNAGILAARMICEGAKREIESRLQGKAFEAERFAVRGAALAMIRELYYCAMNDKAQEKLRRIQPPAGRNYYTGHDALVDLAGWDSVP